MKLRRGIWVLLSTAIHVVVVLLLMQAFFEPRFFMGLWDQRDEPLRPERVIYTEPQPPVVPPTAPAVTRPLVAPEVVPAAIVAAPPDTGSAPPISNTPPVAGATGRGAAGAGDPPTAGKDPRIWAPRPIPMPPVLEPPRPTGLAGIRFSLDSAVKARQDSIAKLRDPTDWTVGEGKTKIGLDPQWIYLGPVKLPTMLLGLIPHRIQTNPNAAENARTLGVMASDAREIGQRRALAGEEIKSINARMERERAARLARSKTGTVPPP